MRAGDILITAAWEDASLLDTTRQVDAADLVLKAGRPVLVVGGTVDKLDLRNVVVAWKDTREARRAVEDALPLLMLADRVTVVEVASDEELAAARIRTDDVADWLARHGVAASARTATAVGDDFERLSSIAMELDAGLVVGGAYGHTRLREWVLGGVTRNLLLRPARLFPDVSLILPEVSGGPLCSAFRTGRFSGPMGVDQAAHLIQEFLASAVIAFLPQRIAQIEQQCGIVIVPITRRRGLGGVEAGA